MVAMNVNEFIQNCWPQHTKAKHGLKNIQEQRLSGVMTIKEDDDGTYKVTMMAVRGERMGHEQQYTSI